MRVYLMTRWWSRTSWSSRPSSPPWLMLSITAMVLGYRPASSSACCSFADAATETVATETRHRGEPTEEHRVAQDSRNNSTRTTDK